MHTTLEVLEGRLVFAYQPPGQTARVLVIDMIGECSTLDIRKAWEMDDEINQSENGPFEGACSTLLACMVGTIPVIYTMLNHTLPKDAAQYVSEIVDACFVETEQALFQ